MTALIRLAALGLSLPTVPTPVANYVPGKRLGDLLYLSGQGPRDDSGGYHQGKVGAEVSADQAYQHARLAGLALLAVAHSLYADLDKLEVVKIFGMVNATPEFGQHPQVINGCSDLFVEVLGERGRHARSAVGMGSLPGNMTVEVEAIFRILD
ncbi:RidA family protein [Pseudomonas typographi]|uniref:RidA family protein n=1 Tax=Pseudomonas typographi TaxID=2715964 RepID=A0ABR7Z0Z3_9PSED|nr:RidA family protein [Pseudomonas typographi]MBD1554820.1 RidA family protein [Pseudomonas typographi]MBD1587343.1 RidA family protein [Pseudomonas typographi]MBD1599161.1 RidA family protein [Pseudomonas typographi]